MIAPSRWEGFLPENSFLMLRKETKARQTYLFKETHRSEKAPKITVAHEGPLGPEKETILLKKMFAAIDLELSDCQLIEVLPTPDAGADSEFEPKSDIIFCLGYSKRADLNFSTGTRNIFFSPKPSELLKNSKLKKIAWESLKEIAEQLKGSSP